MLILGGVGKSSLVLRFIKGTFKDSYIPTIEDTYRQVTYFQKFFGVEVRLRLTFPPTGH